ncbi:MAG: DUF2905 domain-containing protein [Acidobacteria bacterium]|nr:DUF2905 domain-containing protein [Acidobacteriota bacterium]
MSTIGRSLVLFGLILVVIGALVMLADRLQFRIGRLPGDMVWKGRNSVFYFPLMTSLLVSLLLTLILWVLGRR